jgi:hypothetical protein
MTHLIVLFYTICRQDLLNLCHLLTVRVLALVLALVVTLLLPKLCSLDHVG